MRISTAHIAKEDDINWQQYINLCLLPLAVALYISKAFDRVWYAGFLQGLACMLVFVMLVLWNLKSDIWPYFVFSQNRMFRVALDGKPSQEYPGNGWGSSRLHSWSTLFLLHINNLPDDFICNIAIYADDTTLYSKCDQASDLWEQLELASELESDLRDTVDWGRKWLVDFKAGKTQLVLFGHLITLVLLM